MSAAPAAPAGTTKEYFVVAFFKKKDLCNTLFSADRKEFFDKADREHATTAGMYVINDAVEKLSDIIANLDKTKLENYFTYWITNSEK